MNASAFLIGVAVGWHAPVQIARMIRALRAWAKKQPKEV